MPLLLLIIAAASFRLLPHPANFTPVTALVLFAASRWGMRRGGLAVLGTLLISDALLGFYEPKIMLTVYASFAAAGLLGLWIGKKMSPRRIVLSSLAASTFFYLSTNFAVWAFSPWYTHDAAGLIASYTLALPFFRNAILGDLFFSGVLFGAYALFRRFSSDPPPSPVLPALDIKN